ncbi:MAG TPA: hypothetical protein PLK12_12725 [Prolixibacteraceae bacterium]|nr:hypothetical protein [Prolixibacteraceae bacterium]
MPWFRALLLCGSNAARSLLHAALSHRQTPLWNDKTFPISGGLQLCHHKKVQGRAGTGCGFILTAYYLCRIINLIRLERRMKEWTRFAFVFGPKTTLEDEKQNILSNLRTTTENYRYFSRAA